MQVRQATGTVVRISLRAGRHADVQALASAARRAGGRDVTAGWNGAALEVELVVDDERRVPQLVVAIAGSVGARIIRTRSWRVTGSGAGAVSP